MLSFSTLQLLQLFEVHLFRDCKAGSLVSDRLGLDFLITIKNDWLHSFLMAYL